MNRLLLLVTSLFMALLVFCAPAGFVGATAALPLTTQTFTLTSPPTQCTLNGSPCIKATFANNSNSTMLVIAFGVLRNTLGQMVYYTAGTVTPGAGQNGTVYLAISGVPTGSYNATVFVVTTNGVGISTSSSIQVSI